jgi:signal transduction histidine kinase
VILRVASGLQRAIGEEGRVGDTQGSGDERAAPIHRGRRFVVYRVIGRHGERLVVKTPRPDQPRQAAERLRKEYRILRALAARGVSQPLALDEDDGHLALVLEDAGPINLDHWLDHWLDRRLDRGSEALDTGTFLALALQLAHTIYGIHAANIVHGDITPANIVVDPERKVATLVDFDLAATPSEGAGAGPDLRRESPRSYLAPERTGTIDHPTDHRADLYALGATLYRMLTGAPPAPACEHGIATFAPPSALHPELPPAIDAIFGKLLAASPGDRYGRAEQLLEDLHRVAAQLRPGDRPGASSAPTRAARARLRAACSRIRVTRAIAVVAGPPGSGKTALAASLRSDVEEAKGRLVFVRCASQDGTSSPLEHALAAALRELLRKPEKNRALVRARVRAAVGSRARWLAAAIPELAALLGTHAPPAQAAFAVSEGAVPESDRCAALAELLPALVPPGTPLVVVFDDLHEAGATTLRVLRGLVFAPQLRRTLLVATVRDDALEANGALADTLDAMRGADAAFSWIDLDTPSRRAGDRGLSPGARARHLDDLEQAIAMRDQLIDQLLSVSRMQAGAVELERVELVEVVREVVGRLARQVERAGSRVEIRAEPGAWGLWDRARLVQVVTNLLSNAIKFGGGAPITIAVMRSGDRTRLEVSDRGLGLAASVLPSLFQRCVRGVSSRRDGGLGLGLYIVHQIVEAHGGSLEVESAPGRGSTFAVELPRRGPPRADSGSQRSGISLD